MIKFSFQKIKFISFKDHEFKNIINKMGLFLFPAAPALASIEDKKRYFISLKKADFVFLDSSFFVILLRIFKNLKVIRFSGYKFLKLFFSYLKKNKKTSIFLIDPDINKSKNNYKFIKKIGLKQKNINSYIAPFYNFKSIKDKNLLIKIKKYKPNIILINIGGGTQEILGLYLKNNINHKCKIICTGAAISFFTKDQFPINDFIDQYYLGWFVRSIYSPFTFPKRLFYALKLVKIVLKSKITIV